MRKLFSTVLAGVFGGLITLGGIYLMNDGPTEVFYTPTSTAAVQQVKFNTSPSTSVGTAPFDFKVAAALSTPAVVHISSVVEQDPGVVNSPLRFFFNEGGGPPRGGTGSGVIYSTDGYIITNNHVVDGADNVSVTLSDNRTFKATVIGTDKKTDLAVIKIEGEDLPTIKPGNSDEAEVGEWVLAVGNPFDLTSTVTAGIISAKGRSIRILGGGDAIEAFIQTDAAVNPGNSGGALVDTQGRLLGINTAIATQSGSYQGYSFAIPVDLVTRIVDDIIEYGTYQRAYLGVHIYELDDDAAQDLNINISQGVVVSELIDGGSAQYSGMHEQDVIVAIDKKPIKSVPDLQEVIGRAKVGDVLSVTVNRGGQEMDIPVRLKAYNVD
ncbi:MAG: trypsin-like peptidase domain-containing protein [Saprospiraceae bacterium]